MRTSLAFHFPYTGPVSLYELFKMHFVCSLPPPLPSDSHQLVMCRVPQLASGLPINPPGCCQSAKELVTVPPSDKILQKISISQDRHFRKQRPSWVNPLLTCFCKAVCLHFSTPLQMTLHSREMPTPIHSCTNPHIPSKSSDKGHFNHEAFPSISDCLRPPNLHASQCTPNS